MAKTKRPMPTFPLALIESRFQLVPFGEWPPISRNTTRAGWSIRVLTGVEIRGAGVTEKFDYFEIADDGEIIAAPWGEAKNWRPGRIDPAELAAAVQRYELADR